MTAAKLKPLSDNMDESRLDLKSSLNLQNAIELVQQLAINQTLTILDMSENELGPSIVAKLSKALTVNFECLVLIHLGKHNTDSSEYRGKQYWTDRWKRIHSSPGRITIRSRREFQVNTSLTDLDIRLNGIGPASAVAIAESLKESAAFGWAKLHTQVNFTLAKLDISKNNIGAVGGSAFFEMLKVESPHSQDANAAQCMQVNQSLSSLNLSGNGIDESIAAACESVFEVSSPQSSPTLLTRVAQANTTLTSLSIADNSLGQAGAEAFASLLKVSGRWPSFLVQAAPDDQRRSAVTSLDLGRNRFGASAVQMIADAVKVKNAVPLSVGDFETRRTLRSRAWICVGAISSALVVPHWQRHSRSPSQPPSSSFCVTRAIPASQASISHATLSPGPQLASFSAQH